MELCMTPQEIFNFVLDKLLAQKVKALNDRGYCSYRTEKGLRCAFGHFIPDDCYDPRMENKFSLDLIRHSIKFGEKWYQYVKDNDWLYVHRELLSNLQALHDHCLYPVASRQYMEHAKRIATVHNLEFKYEIPIY